MYEIIAWFISPIQSKADRQDFDRAYYVDEMYVKIND